MSLRFPNLDTTTDTPFGKMLIEDTFYQRLRVHMRLLHTMLRVGNLEESLKFYCDFLGMKLLRQKDYPGGEFTLAFVGYGDESDNTLLELTYNWGSDKYDLGDAYGHIAIGVDDIYATCNEIKNCGGKVVREPGPMKHGSTVIAFIEDPDGYKVELIQLGTQGTQVKQESEKQAITQS